MADRNLSIGLSLTLFGLIFTYGAYLILKNIPLTALGIGITIIGAAWALTPPSPIPKEATINMIKSSCRNIEALLEATGASSKAIYLPTEEETGTIAYIPLKNTGKTTLNEIKEKHGRTLIRRGGDLGIIIYPPKPEYRKPTSNNPNPSGESAGELKAELTRLTDEWEIAESIRAAQSDDRIVIEINRPKINVEYPRFKTVLGSLPSCLAAQYVAASTSRPVQIEREENHGNRIIAYLRLLEWTDTPST